MNSAHRRTVFRGGDVFDGTGHPPARADIVVADGRITDVGLRLDGDEEVNLTGSCLLPGFIDCHVHAVLTDIDFLRIAQKPFSLRFLEAARNLEQTLRAGITTVRDAGGADLGIKTAQEMGLFRGPRMQVSLQMMSQTGGHGDPWLPSGACLTVFPAYPGMPGAIADGVDGVRTKVRELVRAGADVIKVASSGGVLSPRSRPENANLSPEELETIVHEAAAAGLVVMAHAQSAAGVMNAVRAGVRSIEHGIWLDDSAIEMMVDRGTYLVPTLVAPQGVLRSAESGQQIPETMLSKARAVVDAHRSSFARAVAAGVNIAMGTDSPITPHGQNLRELELMVAGGMDPAAALKAATQGAACLMGIDDRVGTLEVGKVADIVVVDGDPLDVSDIAQRVRGVYVGGHVVPAPSIA